MPRIDLFEEAKQRADHEGRFVSGPNKDESLRTLLIRYIFYSEIDEERYMYDAVYRAVIEILRKEPQTEFDFALKIERKK